MHAGVVVLDAALLLDWEIADSFDLVVAVLAPLEARLDRLVSGGLTREEALERVEAQRSDEEYAELSDETIENDGTLEELESAVRSLWDRMDEISEEQKE